MECLLTNNVSLNDDIDTDSFTGAILQFVNTSNPQNGISQAEILIRRPIHDTVPVRPRSQIFDNGNIHPLWRTMWREREGSFCTRFTKQMDTLEVKSKALTRLNVGDVCKTSKTKTKLVNFLKGGTKLGK